MTNPNAWRIVSEPLPATYRPRRWGVVLIGMMAVSGIFMLLAIAELFHLYEDIRGVLP